jgi:hypothetical protein
VSTRFTVTGQSLHFLSDSPLVVGLFDTASGTALGSATVARAETVLPPRAVASGEQGLHTALALTRFHLTPNAPRGAAAVLAYAALRGGRALGRTAVVVTPESTEPGVVDLLALSPLPGDAGLKAGRLDIALVPTASPRRPRAPGSRPWRTPPLGAGRPSRQGECGAQR